MFTIFSPSMYRGEVCKFYELASSKNSQDECLANYNETPDFYEDASGFRYPAFLLGLYAPAAFFLVELFLNQLLISWKQLVLQYFFTIFYAVATAMWQLGTGNAVIFPDRLDWNSSDLFNECFLWFLCFMLVQTGCFAFVLLIHYLKAKFVCKVSVPVIAFTENDAKDLGSLTANKTK